MHNLVTSLLVDRFEAECGKWQVKAEDGVGFAMLVEFGLPLDYAKEHGHRYLDLAVYGPMNYVQVYGRTRWTVISDDDLEWDEEQDEDVIKDGCDYDEGASDWVLWSDHDSGWRDGIDRLLRSVPRLLSVRVQKAPLSEVFPSEEEHLAAKSRRPGGA